MTEREHQRIVRHRLAVLRHAAEVTGNVAQTCRFYGISRQTFYDGCAHTKQGVEGLKDRSSKPHHSPNATNEGRLLHAYLRIA